MLWPIAGFGQHVADSGIVGKAAVDTTNRVAHVASIASSQPKRQPFQPNPKRAGLYSAIVPGLGQFYNRQYWKVPIVYAGLGVAVYFISDNLTHYQSYRKAYISRFNTIYYTDQYANIYSKDQLNQLQSDYKKYLDLSILLTGVGYTLQVIEAMTGAHLKNFDISRDISFQMMPVVQPEGLGLGMVMHIR